jgi:Ni,Fe-hydrogenase III large subunit
VGGVEGGVNYTSDHAERLHAFAVEMARAMREGDSAALDAITARQRAAGYGGAIATHMDAISAVQPRERPSGPWLHCPRCGAEQLAHQVEEHDARAADPDVWSLCRARIAEGHAPTAPRNDDGDEKVVGMFGDAA